MLPKPPQIVPPIGNHVFKYLNLWETFLIPTTTVGEISQWLKYWLLKQDQEAEFGFHNLLISLAGKVEHLLF